MRVSHNWLGELIPGLPGDPRLIEGALSAVGLEVEAVMEVGIGLESVRVAQVLSVHPHPKRDKLRLVTVSLGRDVEQTVVCGASNVPVPGGLVVLAPLGTTLLAVGLTLEPRDIGGVKSEGMLCSERELGLAAESDGILTFPAGAHPPGCPFVEAFPTARDTIFVLGVTPNRPDALGHVGVARDLAARLGLDLLLPVVSAGQDGGDVEGRIRLDNRATEACPRYGAAVVDGIVVRPSPPWVRWRLHALGVRPISNVVDVTNLLLLEQGSPMHAFDLDRVQEQQIVIRHADMGESMTTLDGKVRELTVGDLVIADARGPVALAGVMGGQDSEIRDDTRSVLLECAYFDPSGIRRTSRRLGLQTDSSHRFERGVDFGAIERVLGRAVDLLEAFASGKPVRGQLFADGVAPTPPEVRLRSARLDGLLGLHVDFERATALLERLGFECLDRQPDAARFRVPSFRPDVTLEADLVEEVARMVGLDHVPAELPRVPPRRPSVVGQLERAARRCACELGLSEAVTYSFVSRDALKLLGAPDPVVVLKNPLSEEREVMTTSLLPGLLEATGRAERHGERRVALFAVGSAFRSPHQVLPDASLQRVQPRDPADLGTLPEERSCLAFVLSGERPAYLEKGRAFDVYDAKGLACELVERLVGVAPGIRQEALAPTFHPRAAALLTVSDTVVGRFGTLHPDVGDALGLGAPVQLAELDLTALETLERRVARYVPVPRLPAIQRDVALEAPESLRVGDLAAAIQAAAGELCESVELFDVFRPEGSSKRSLAFRLVYRDPKATTQPDAARTLTDKEIEGLQAKVVQRAAELGATLRA